MQARRFIGSLVVPVVAASLGCRNEPPRTATTKLTIATGSADGVYYSVGRALAAVYSRRPALEATAEVRENPIKNVEEVENGTADLAFDGAGHAYMAFKHGTDADHRPHAKLRAVAVLFSTSVQIAARSDTAIHSVKDFRGKRVSVGSPGSLTDEASRLILENHGLSYDTIVASHSSGHDLVDEIRARRLDGFLLYSPLRPSTMVELAESSDIRLIPIERDRITDIQSQSPFLLKTVMIPAGTYKGQANDIATIGADILLLCRSDLPDQLVLELTRSLFAAVPELAAAHPAAAEIDPDRGPSASVPLHPGAARYYRERELLR